MRTSNVGRLASAFPIFALCGVASTALSIAIFYGAIGALVALLTVGQLAHRRRRFREASQAMLRAAEAAKGGER